MNNSLPSAMIELKLPGATIFHNQDRTHAKCFVGEGDGMKVKGVSTEERWKPDALTQAVKWAMTQGVAVPPKLQTELGLREPENSQDTKLATKPRRKK